MKNSRHAPKLLPTGSPCNGETRRCPVDIDRAERRILIIQTGANGDILMSTPLLTALRDRYPTAHITWIAEHSAMESIDTHPLLDSVIRWDGSYFRQPQKKGSVTVLALRWLRFGMLLRRGRYDLFVSFEPEQWRPMTLYLRKKAITIGIFDRWHTFDPQASSHKNKRFFDYAFTLKDLPAHRTAQAFLPLRVLQVPPPDERRMMMGYRAEDRAEARQFLRAQGVSDGERYVVVAPMTTWESRCWLISRYAEVCDRLHREHGYRIVLIGSDKERAAIKELNREASQPHISAIGVFSFRVMAAMIGEAALLISGDTGPMHVAGAVGTPFVAIFGSTPVEGRAPLAGRGLSLAHRVPCGPCDRIHCTNPPETHMRCMNLISVEEVMQAALSLLSGSSV